MEKKVSVLDVARAAGVSKAAAGFALKNRPGVSEQTRKHILEVAEKLGYVPDARISSLMAQVREARSKELLPIAWLNTHGEENAWRTYKFHTPYLKGAQERALQLGYRIEEIWAHEPGMSMHRISSILYQRGIEGVIVTYPARHFRLSWDHIAAVSLEGALFAPRLHRVVTDVYFNLLLALKVLKRFGYKKIGICFDEGMDRYVNHGILAASQYFQSTIPIKNRVPVMLYVGDHSTDSREAREKVATWMNETKPDVVVSQAGWMVNCAESAGFKVPEEMGVISLAVDDDIREWAGIDSNRREIGAVAAELVISRIQNRLFGIPKTAANTLIRGNWHPGKTLLIPKPK